MAEAWGAASSPNGTPASSSISASPIGTPMSMSTRVSDGGANGHAKSPSGSTASSRGRSSSDSSANVLVSRQLMANIVERHCVHFRHFADPVNTGDGLK